MALISLRSCSHVKASMVLTRVEHLFIHNYIRSLLNIILTPIIDNDYFIIPTVYEPAPD